MLLRDDGHLVDEVITASVVSAANVVRVQEDAARGEAVLIRIVAGFNRWGRIGIIRIEVGIGCDQVTRFAVIRVDRRAAIGAGRTGRGEEARARDVALPDQPVLHPVELGTFDVVLPIICGIDVESALVELRAGGEIDVPGIDLRGGVAGGDFEALEAFPRDDVGDACYCLRAVSRGGAVRQNLDALDHRQRELVDVDEVGTGVVRNRRNASAPAVQQGQSRTQPQVTDIELRDAGAGVGLVVILGAAVDR